MSEVVVRLCSQEGRDAEGRLQSHQWAELPAELARPYLSGGLKKVRRLTEGYFGYRFWEHARRVHGRWRAGEPHLTLRYYRLPGLHGREIAHLGGREEPLVLGVPLRDAAVEVHVLHRGEPPHP